MVSVTASYSPKYILLEALNNGQALPFLTTAQQTFVGLEDVLKTSSTRLQRNNFSSSKTSWKYVFKTSCEMTSRRLGDKQNVYWNICVKPWPTSKSKSVFNKSISHKSLFHQSKANPNCIN